MSSGYYTVYVRRIGNLLSLGPHWGSKKRFFLCCLIFSCTYDVAISIKDTVKKMFFVLCYIFLYICCCHFNQNNAKNKFFVLCNISLFICCCDFNQNIAKKHLISKQLKANGLEDFPFKLDSNSLKKIIQGGFEPSPSSLLKMGHGK